MEIFSFEKKRLTLLTEEQKESYEDGVKKYF